MLARCLHLHDRKLILTTKNYQTLSPLAVWSPGKDTQILPVEEIFIENIKEDYMPLVLRITVTFLGLVEPKTEEILYRGNCSLHGLHLPGEPNG